MGKGEELAAVGFDGLGFEEAVACGGDHDGIDDEFDVGIIFEDVGNGGDVGGGAEHAGFDDLEGKGFEHEEDLVFKHGWRDGIDAADDVCCFRDDASDCG